MMCIGRCVLGVSHIWSHGSRLRSRRSINPILAKVGLARGPLAAPRRPNSSRQFSERILRAPSSLSSTARWSCSFRTALRCGVTRCITMDVSPRSKTAVKAARALSPPLPYGQNIDLGLDPQTSPALVAQSMVNQTPSRGTWVAYGTGGTCLPREGARCPDADDDGGSLSALA